MSKISKGKKTVIIFFQSQRVRSDYLQSLPQKWPNPADMAPFKLPGDEFGDVEFPESTSR